MIKLIPNIILSGEKLKAFSLRSETRQRHPLTSFLFKIVLEFLSMTIRERKRCETNLKRKNTTVTAQDATRKLLELIK